MSSAVLERPELASPPPTEPTGRRWSRLRMALVVLAAWAAAAALLWNRFTLPLESSDTTAFQDWVSERLEAFDQLRQTAPLFVSITGAIRDGINAVVSWLDALIAVPTPPAPSPTIGWLGVVAILTYLTFVIGTWRTTILTAVGFVTLGLLGLWSESMQTLSLTIVAVLLSLVVGIPLGILAGKSRRIERVVTPVLDLAQIMPTFVYLLPVTLLFLISPASWIIVTMVYAIPPALRITAVAIREVDSSPLEASTSLGATRWQNLGKVELPLAKRTIVIGINQTIMAAFSMVTIAAVIGAPGLGETVFRSLVRLDVGNAFRGGIAIVIMAVVLDRATTAWANRQRIDDTRPAGKRLVLIRRVGLVVGAIATLIAAQLSRTYLDYAVFPGDGGLGTWVAKTSENITEWATTNLTLLTDGLQNFVTSVVINPLQAVLTSSPWFVVIAAVTALAWTLGGLRTAVGSAICLLLIVGTGLWQASMATLAQVLVGATIVLILGVVVGVWMGRSNRVDALVRPILDAGQVLPAFVYLVPFLGLFGATRFTAIAAAVVYAAPAAIKLVASGVRGVPVTIVEAATAAGSSSWQLIRKVQLPCARRSVALAANQGVIYVLAMVVVGGLVGGGGLGNLVIAGFTQPTLRGKGFVAGIAIVLLGILVDRMTQAAARDPRSDSSVGAGH